MNLLCLSDFNQGNITAKAGEVCWFMPDVARWLLDSWPGSWAIAEVAAVDRLIGMADDLVNNPASTAGIQSPPVDKQIHAPTKAKGRKR